MSNRGSSKYNLVLDKMWMTNTPNGIELILNLGENIHSAFTIDAQRTEASSFAAAARKKSAAIGK